jgi:hypothetical protein
VAAKLTLFPARGASRHFVLRDGESGRLGRDPGANELVVDDPRVSASHARLEWTGGRWALIDLSSKNGTFVSGSPAAGRVLGAEEWVSFGGLLGRFELVSDEEVAELESERRRRLHTSVEITRELARETDPPALLGRLLDSVVSLIRAERGFVLLIGPRGNLVAEVARGFSAGALDAGFEGSFGAIERVLETGESVVASDAPAHAWLGRRPSVLELGITTLACVPVKSPERLIGLVYVDGRQGGGAFTDLDLEILETLADNVGVVLSALRIDREIREMLAPGGAASGDDREFLEGLERRVAAITGGGGGTVPRPARGASGS